MPRGSVSLEHALALVALDKPTADGATERYEAAGDRWLDRAALERALKVTAGQALVLDALTPARDLHATPAGVIAPGSSASSAASGLPTIGSEPVPPTSALCLL